MTNESTITYSQKKTFGPVFYTEGGRRYRITAKARFDDDCRNGHNTFAVTADIDERRGNTWVESAGGCCHDEIARHFPQLAPLIKWHLCSTDGPTHYLGNTLYLAGDRDHWGKKAGEPRMWETHIQFGDNPIKHRLDQKFVAWLQEFGPCCDYDFEVIAVHYKREPGNFGPYFTFGGYDVEWHYCPFKSEEFALDFLAALQSCEPQFVKVVTAWGEGKEPDLEAARSTAIWPDATLEQLQDKAALEARLPGLLADFRRDIEALGFTW